VRKNAWVAGCLAAAAAVSLPARADPGVEAIAVDYDAPPACPSVDAFFAEVLARTPKARRASAPSGVRTFSVLLTTGTDESLGRLFIRAPDGTESERDVAGDTCAEVVSALALMTALAVDPQASTQAVAPTPAPAPAPAPSPAPSWHLALTFDASVEDGVSARPLFGAPIALEGLAPSGALPSPSFRLAFQRASSGAVDVGGPTATFTWTLAIAEACPHRWDVGSLSLSPCARVEAGTLEATGANVVPAHDDTHPWVALGAVAKAEWTFARPMFLDFETGIRFPLYRTTYFFEPDNPAFQLPVVGGVASLGLGVRFL
jgi:hypothetical protein